MKWLLFLALCVGVRAFVFKLPEPKQLTTFSVGGFLYKQKLILKLFDNVCSESTDPIIVKLSNDFNLIDADKSYLKPDVAISFKNIQEGRGFTPAEEKFSEFNKTHMEELKMIYDLFYYAKDFDVFFVTAAWARQTLNCGIFTDALYSAIFHRKDLQNVYIPAPYYLMPNLYFDKDSLVQAFYLSKNIQAPVSEVRTVGNTFKIDVNYTKYYYNEDLENKLAYFFQDINLNVYNYFMTLKDPFWTENKNVRDTRGEFWIHFIKQMNARYNLERYANDLGGIKDFSWGELINTGHKSVLMYADGNSFPERPYNFAVKVEPNLEDIDFLERFEANFYNIVTEMLKTYDAKDKHMVMNAIYDLLHSDQDYIGTTRRVLGASWWTYKSKTIPSELELEMTSIRDPMYWQLNKKLVDLVNSIMYSVPPYEKSELYYPGIEIIDVQVKKMNTFFENYDYDVTDIVEAKDFSIDISVPRLNHQPFTLMVNVSSLVAEKALVKIFLGPKLSPGEMINQNHLYMLLDSFEYAMKIGSNIIKRKSQEILNVSNDLLSLNDLVKAVEEADLGLRTISFNDLWSNTGFPMNLLLPKGKPEGLSLQLFIVVASFTKASEAGSPKEFNEAVLSPGYPLDHTIIDGQMFNLPNIYFKDILITHKESELTKDKVSKKGDKEFDTSSKGQFDYASKKTGEPFDYKSKKEQYSLKSSEPKTIDEKPEKLTYESPKNYETNSENIPDITNRPHLFLMAPGKKIDTSKTIFPKTKNVATLAQDQESKIEKNFNIDKKTIKTFNKEYIPYASQKDIKIKGDDSNTEIIVDKNKDIYNIPFSPNQDSQKTDTFSIKFNPMKPLDKNIKIERVDDAFNKNKEYIPYTSQKDIKIKGADSNTEIIVDKNKDSQKTDTFSIKFNPMEPLDKNIKIERVDDAFNKVSIDKNYNQPTTPKQESQIQSNPLFRSLGNDDYTYDYDYGRVYA